MPRVLITAFGPYEGWRENASWLALVEFARHLPHGDVHIVTRRYPVDFSEVRGRLREDLAADYDYVLHLGQAPGAAQLRLEAIGVNVGGALHEPPESYRELVTDGAVAYRSALPLNDWAQQLRRAGIPAGVSFHAGEYLCNATLYLTHYWIEKLGLKSQAAFIHLPIAPQQAVECPSELPSMPSKIAAQAVQLLVTQLIGASSRCV